MWLLFNKSIQVEKPFVQGGKALFLCQRFEDNCKYIMKMGRISNALSQKKFTAFEQSHMSYVDKLSALLLGPAMNAFKNEFRGKFSDEIFEKLNSARDSRNFICHELLKDLNLYNYVNKPNFEIDQKQLKLHVENIAKGDHIVSTWIYEYQEGAPAMIGEVEYVNKVLLWIRK